MVNRTTDMNECEQFELELQQAMDLRLPPRELCGDHPHPGECAACRQLLEDFCRLDDSLATLCQVGRGTPDQVDDDATIRAHRVHRATPEPEWTGGRRAGVFPKALAFSVALLVALAAFAPNRAAHAPRGMSIAQRGVGDPSGGLGITGGLLMAASNGQLTRSESVPREASGDPVVDRATAGRAESSSRSLVSCFWLADQLPGVPPIRRSAFTTLDWIRQVLPTPPQLPPLPDWLPDFSQRGMPQLSWLA